MTASLPPRSRLFGLRSLGGPSLAVLVSLSLAGCQTTSLADQSDSVFTGTTEAVSLKAAALAGQKWDANPSDVKAGLHYAELLSNMGQVDKCLGVLGELVKKNPQDVHLKELYGKQLAEAGHSEEAVGVLGEIASGGKADWRIYSALGSAYDQQGQFKEARDAYQTALKLKPGDITIINNMGMSYALEGNLKQAEATFRQAMALPAGAKEPRVRQNLALVVGLQGRFDEAREIASKDLPPEAVEANMAILQDMLSQPDPWKKLTKPTEAPQATSG